ncbi:MAG: hypothetical protein K0R43_1696 [Pseudoduganella sp.]|jgi:hypothetical protein|nr:hypothetical protein [Pseudoduganella sp.]
MAYNVPEGSLQQFSATFASAKTITAVTNANPAVATSTAHGYTTNDEILLTSGWEDATDTVFRIEVVDANSFKILGLNTTNTSFFPAGTGTGTAQKISAWQTIPQVLTIASSGGDPKFTEVNPLSKRNGLSIPTGFNSSNLTLTLGHDATNATYQQMLDISRSLSKVAFRQVLSGPSYQYGYGYMATSEVPQLNAGQVNQVTSSLAFQGRVISY